MSTGRLLSLIICSLLVSGAIGTQVARRAGDAAQKRRCMYDCWDRSERLIIDKPLEVYIDDAPVTDVDAYFGAAYPEFIEIRATPSDSESSGVLRRLSYVVPFIPELPTGKLFLTVDVERR
ncbi:MAG: hypothetical protein D6800_08890 [Candidatus Zixiibacteriota bacterium]|nr:MAG: hypothetical protein D6800_08890 [candidate division Zixibacteria bacterium]